FSGSTCTAISVPSLHGALPISGVGHELGAVADQAARGDPKFHLGPAVAELLHGLHLAVAAAELVDDRARVGAVALHDQNFVGLLDRKRTRLNSSHVKISYAVFW